MQLPQLTVTRFIASIAIVYLHFGLYNWPMNHPLMWNFSFDLMSAITFFFVLSGFILVVSSCKNGVLPSKIEAKSFWKRRIARIVPMYLFALIAFFMLTFDYNPELALFWQIQSYLYAIFFLQSWNYLLVMDVNFPSWSLSVEAFFYLVFPLLYSLFIRLKLTSVIVIGIAIWLLNLLVVKSMLIVKVPVEIMHFSPIFHLSNFIIGIGAGLLFVKNHEALRERGKMWIYLTTLLLTIVVIYCANSNFPLFDSLINNGILAPYFVLLLISIALFEGNLKSFLSWKPFQFLGEISYSIYILQLPVMLLCRTYIPGLAGKKDSELFFPYLGILILTSILCYLLIEQPAKKAINKYSLKRKSN
jgi:peptidoglycan/LPS O-acetylase OafA/YrhL